MSIHDEFDSLFDEIKSDSEDKPVDDNFTFDEGDDSTPSIEENGFPVEKEDIPESDQSADFEQDPEQLSPPQRKRTSDDFEPDMDALLVTAQSSMIMEGIKNFKEKNFSAGTLAIYLEALKGLELYIKILQRNPNNYHKLGKIINSDIDSQEVEKIAFKLYLLKFNDEPGTDDQKERAFELLRNRLKVAYYKALISSSMIKVKTYFLLSGGLDQDRVTRLAMSGDMELKSDVAKLSQHLKLAIQMSKTGNQEIAKGMKGKDLSIFIIKTSQLLSYYYLAAGNHKVEDYYRRIYENYKKYFVIR